MKFKDKLKYIKKRSRNEAIFYTIAISLLTLIITTLFSFSGMLDYYYSKSIKEDYSTNYFFVSNLKGVSITEFKNDLLSINHVEEFFTTNEFINEVEVDKIGDKEITGGINLYGASEEYLKELSNGKYSDYKDVVCSEFLIPIEYLDLDISIRRSDLLDTKKYMGESISIFNKLYNGESNEVFRTNLHIVSVFKNKPLIIDENVCYTSRRFLNEMMNNVYKYTPDLIDNANMLVRLDDRLNFDEVSKDILSMGYSIMDPISIDYSLYDTINTLKYSSIGIGVLFVLIIIVVLNKKRISDKKQEYKILKSVGLNDEEYLNIIRLENIIIILKSLISSILLLLFFIVVLNIVVYFRPFLLGKLPIIVNIWGIILYFCFTYFIIELTSYICFKNIIVRDFK